MGGGADGAIGHAVMFREVNERIAELTGTTTSGGVMLFVCECSHLACADALEVTLEEYERARVEGTHFLVAPGHEVPEHERVVGRSTRFVVVEKRGEAAVAALDSNPRHARAPLAGAEGVHAGVFAGRSR